MNLWLIPAFPSFRLPDQRPVRQAFLKTDCQPGGDRFGSASRSPPGWSQRRFWVSAIWSTAQPSSAYYTWIQSGTLNIGVDFAVDRLTAVMLLIVTGVGLLIHIYALGYMEHEGGYYRFFSYMNLFMFFMLILVLAQNYLLLFVGWEGVGFVQLPADRAFTSWRNLPLTQGTRRSSSTASATSDSRWRCF